MLNIRALAYVVAETSDLKRWSEYASKVLGVMVSESPNGDLYLKMDERGSRLKWQSSSEPSSKMRTM